MPDAKLARFTRRQHGLAVRAQVLAVMTERQLTRRLADGRLERLHAGVYRSVTAPETWEQILLAACLAAGPGTVASFRSAARLWRFAGFQDADEIEVTTPTRRRARVDGARVHDSAVLGRKHTARAGAIPATSPARTLCDLTACVPPWDVERALDDALRRKLTTLTTLHGVFLDLATKGRRRSTVMRALLEARIPGFDPGDSDMETKLVRWIVGAGLPRPVQQHRVRVNGRSYRLDLAYPELLIGIEYDGWDPHRTRSAFDGDRARQNPLEILGWLVLRYTSKSSRDTVIREVGAAIAARAGIRTRSM